MNKPISSDRHPADPPATTPWQERFDAGMNHYRDGAYDLAAGDFKAALAADSGRSEAWLALAGVRIATKEHELALQAVRYGLAALSAAQAVQPVEWPLTDTAVWRLDAAGTLLIRGTGPIPNCQDIKSKGDASTAPWADYTDRIQKIVISPGITEIGGFAFRNCTGLTDVSIPDGVADIWPQAFAGCTGLTTVTIPGSVTRIWQSAFSGCTSLTNVRITDGVAIIGPLAFFDCTNLTGVMLPDSITDIGPNAFGNCTSLTDILIPNSVERLWSWAFRGCTGLTDVSISDSIDWIERDLFSDCTSLKDIWFGGTEAHWNALTANSGIPSTATVHFNARKWRHLS